MGIFHFFKKIQHTVSVSPSQASPTPTSTAQSAPAKKLTYSEKERLAVQRTTQADVIRLTGFPYAWNRNIEKFITPHGHPFVYMDIVGTNIVAAKSELKKMNEYINRDKTLCKKLPQSLRIPVDDIIFTRSSMQGYTRLICSPVTHDGKPTSSPISLSFTTNLERSDTTTGDIHYDSAGSIYKAEIFFWRRGNGYFLHYDTVDGDLVLSRVEVPDYSSGSKSVIYKGQHLLDLEARRIQDAKDYEWLQNTLPDQCPKNITSYRRIKTQNTKN